MPPIWVRPADVQTARTVISFLVRVPVLSEQMTEAEPSVSTAGSLRIKAFRLTMRWTPRAKAIVTTAGSPSGMAATARLTEVRNMSRSLPPRRSSSPKTTATRMKQA